jgi:hypothetical protein
LADLLSSLEPVGAVERLSKAAVVLRQFARDDAPELLAAELRQRRLGNRPARIPL